MNSDKKYQFLQFVINYLLLPIACLFLLILCLLIFATTSHAADPSYFPMGQDDNEKFTDEQIARIERTANPEQYYIFAKYLSRDNANSRNNYLVVYWPKDVNYGLYGEIATNGYQFTLYQIGSGGLNIRQMQIPDNGSYNNITTGFSLGSFGTMNSSLYDTNSSYVSNFRLYVSNTENADVVLKYGPDPIPPLDIGVAIIPPDAFVPDYPNGTTPPSEVPPIFTPNDYQWTTPPNFDGSSVTNAIGSIQNTLGWLANNLKEEFKNITDNGKHFVEYIGKTIQYYGNAIIDTLNNAIKNFYDNMANLVQPIFDKVNYITQPFDSDAISTAFNQNGLISVKNDFIDFFNDFDDIIRNTQEPDTFDITINIQNVRTFYNFGCRSPVVLHLGNNLNGTTKTVFRAFLWILVIVGSIFLTEKNLSAWIKGGGFSDK